MKYIVILITLLSITLIAKTNMVKPKIKKVYAKPKFKNKLNKKINKNILNNKKVTPKKMTTTTNNYVPVKAHAFTLMNQNRRFSSLKKILFKTSKKYVFLTFFTNSCKVCPKERTQLKELSKKYNNFEVVYIASRIGKDEEVNEFMKSVKATISKEKLNEVFLDVYDVVAKFYGVKKLNAINVPRLFIIDVKSGNIVKEIKGYHKDLETILKNELK